jgi:hypothetical protein
LTSLASPIFRYIIANSIIQKEIGSYNLWQTLDGLEAFSLRVLTTVYKWEVEEVTVFLAQVRKNFFNPKMQIQHD